MASVCFNKDDPDKLTHMRHLVNQMPFKTATLTADDQNDLKCYLRIYGQKNGSIMTFLNKHVQFTSDRYNLERPPVIEYQPQDIGLLQIARKLVCFCCN